MPHLFDVWLLEVLNGGLNWIHIEATSVDIHPDSIRNVLSSIVKSEHRRLLALSKERSRMLKVMDDAQRRGKRRAASA